MCADPVHLMLVCAPLRVFSLHTDIRPSILTRSMETKCERRFLWRYDEPSVLWEPHRLSITLDNKEVCGSDKRLVSNQAWKSQLL